VQTLPSSGPTAAQIVHRAQDTSSEFRFNIVPLDSKAVEELNQAQQNKAAATMTLPCSHRQRARRGPGDVLNITIYEVGVSLFAEPSPQQRGVFDPSAHGEKLPAVTVDEQGRISLPYGGTFRAAGLFT
jgi:polysaccharide export outer membrane protein